MQCSFYASSCASEFSQKRREREPTVAPSVHLRHCAIALSSPTTLSLSCSAVHKLFSVFAKSCWLWRFFRRCISEHGRSCSLRNCEVGLLGCVPSGGGGPCLLVGTGGREGRKEGYNELLSARSRWCAAFTIWYCSFSLCSLLLSVSVVCCVFSSGSCWRLHCGYAWEFWGRFALGRRVWKCGKRLLL